MEKYYWNVSEISPSRCEHGVKKVSEKVIARVKIFHAVKKVIAAVKHFTP